MCEIVFYLSIFLPLLIAYYLNKVQIKNYILSIIKGTNEK